MAARPELCAFGGHHCWERSEGVDARLTRAARAVRAVPCTCEGPPRNGVVPIGLETTTVPTTTVTPRTGPSVTAVFLAHLSRFEAHARFAFRRLGCPHARADRVAETLALAWVPSLPV